MWQSNKQIQNLHTIYSAIVDIHQNASILSLVPLVLCNPAAFADQKHCLLYLSILIVSHPNRYHDLIDKSVPPTYVMEADPSCVDGSTVLLRFTAGAPYEDIAFRWGIQGCDAFKYSQPPKWSAARYDVKSLGFTLEHRDNFLRGAFSALVHLELIRELGSLYFHWSFDYCTCESRNAGVACICVSKNQTGPAACCLVWSLTERFLWAGPAS